MFTIKKVSNKLSDKELDEARQTLQILERRQEHERLRYFFQANRKMWHMRQIEWHTTIKRNKWTLSGNRTGKTVAGAVEVVISILGENARKYMADWPREMQEKYEPLVTRFNKLRQVEAWVVSLTNEVQRDVAQKEILKWLPKSEYDPAKVSVRLGRKDDLENAVIDTLPLKNGRKIGFKSCDQGREKFQGTSKPLIWFDEEPPKEIYDECLMRTLDCKGFIIGTMTPLLGLTFIYDDIYLNGSKPIDKQDREIYCVQWTWDDNPHLSDDEKNRLVAMLDPNELEARKYGRFVMPGKCVFDAKALAEMLEKCKPGERGHLRWVDERQKKVKWEPDELGDYEVWFHPNDDDEYLITADVAEGLEHGDYDAVPVLNRDKVRVEAAYHGHIDADVLAEYLRKLAVYYGDVLVAPEGNNHGLTTISHLKQDYANIYKTTTYDKHSDKEQQKLGWYTTPKTRPLLVDAIKRAVREGYIECYWRRFVDEAMSFVRHSNGKEEARSGYWDDVVIALGIAMHIHNTLPLAGSLPEPYVPGAGDSIRAGWQKDKQGREIFIHPSRIEDMMRQEWGGDDEW